MVVMVMVERMDDLWPLNGVMFSPCGTSRCCRDEKLQINGCKVKIVLTYQLWRQQARQPDGLRPEEAQMRRSVRVRRSSCLPPPPGCCIVFRSPEPCPTSHTSSPPSTLRWPESSSPYSLHSLPVWFRILLSLSPKCKSTFGPCWSL